MKSFREFGNIIQGLNMWKYAEIKSCLIKFDNSQNWKIAFLEILLLEQKQELSGNRLPTIQHAKFIHEVYTVERLYKILQDIDDSNMVSIDGIDASLDMIQPQVDGDLYVRSYINDYFKIDLPAYVVNRTGSFYKLREVERQISQELRQNNPPFESLRDFCKSAFNVDFGTDAFPLFVRCLAPIDAKISKIHTENRKLSFVLDVGENINTKNLLLNIFGKNDDGTVTNLRESVRKFIVSGHRKIKSPKLKLPEDVSHIDAILYFKNDVIDELHYHLLDNLEDIKQAVQYANSKECKKAIKLFNIAIDKNPDDKELAIKIADILVSLGISENAIKLYDQVLEKDPENAIAFYKKGLALSDSKKFLEAISYYDKSLEIDQSNPDVWNYKGLALTDLRKYEDAVRSFDRSLKIKPNNPYVLNTKGLCLDNLGSPNEAIELYNEALKIDPDLAEAWNNKGFLLNKLGKYEEAISCYDKALEINPRDAPAWHNKGIILSEIGENESAVECYDKALRINPYLATA